MIEIKKHLDVLGLKVEDRVTGYTGTVTSVGFDLYGCIQAVVNPGLKDNGELSEQCWFDIARLKVLSEEPVMERPDFYFGEVAKGKKGAAEKPIFIKN